MSQRILSRTQQQTLNNTQSQLDNHYIPIGIKTNVYKFRQVSGSIYLTRFGELTNKVQADTQNQLFQLYTGKEPIVVVWDGSTNLSANSENNTIKQQCNVGKYETGYLTQPKEITLETKTKNLYGKEYAMDIIKNNITLQFNNWIPTEDDIRDYFYVILDEKAKSIKWLQIESAIQVFNESSNNFQYCEVAFTNVGDKYTQTGKSILDFIQVQPIGDGYCFPKEEHKANGDIVVSLDESKLPHNVKPANTLQLDFTSGAGLSSILCFGRRQSNLIKSDNGVYNYEIDKPHILLPYDIVSPNVSQFFYNQPNLNSYIYAGAQPTKEGIWKSYKDAFRQNDRIGEYNILNQKEVMTGLKINQDEIRKTNKGLKVNTNWTNTARFDINFASQLAYDTNPYSHPIVNFSKNVNYVEFLTINSMINFSSDVFDYDYRETKKWKLTDVLGILGNIVNTIVGGLDIGWTSSNIIGDISNDLNVIIPCITYEDGMLALDKAAPLPLDVFFDDKSQKVLPTSTNVLSSWRFRYTDQFMDESQIKEGREIGKGGKGVWNTKYLGQTKYEDGTWINDDHSPLRLNFKNYRPAIPSNYDFSFVIDYLDFKAIASCDYRISCYDKGNNPIYYYVGETNSKARGDIRIWGNAIKFNFWDRYNTSGEINYPQEVVNPTPNQDLIGFDVLFDSQESLKVEHSEWIPESNFPDLYFKETFTKYPGHCGPAINPHSHCSPSRESVTFSTNWPHSDKSGDNYTNQLIGFSEKEFSSKEFVVNYSDQSVDYIKLKRMFLNFNDKQIGTLKIDIEQQEGQDIQVINKTFTLENSFFHKKWISDTNNMYAFSNRWGKFNYWNNTTDDYVGYDLYYNIKQFDIQLTINKIERNLKIVIQPKFDLINLQKISTDTGYKLERKSGWSEQFSISNRNFTTSLPTYIDLTLQNIKLTY